MPADDFDEFDDPGLARERTEMAWQRTGIAIGAIGVALIRLLPTETALWMRYGLAIVFIGLGAISIAYGDLRFSPKRRSSPAAVMTALSLATGAYCVIALIADLAY